MNFCLIMILIKNDQNRMKSNHDRSTVNTPSLKGCDGIFRRILEFPFELATPRKLAYKYTTIADSVFIPSVYLLLLRQSHFRPQMALSQFLKRLPKPLGLHNLPIQVNSTIVLHSHFIHSSPAVEIDSPDTVKNQSFIRKTYTHIKIIPGSISICLLGGKNYCTTSTTAHDYLGAQQKNPDILTHQNAEQLCKIISNHSNSTNLESALNSWTYVELSPILVLEVLKKLSNAGVLALSFFRWAEKQSGFQHTTETYNALIESLGKIKQFKMIWDLVSEMKKKKVLTKDTFALMSRRYARAKKVKEALEAFEGMEKFDLKPELSDYNRLMDTLSKSRQVERAQKVFDEWKNRKFEPDIKSYTILLEGWGQEKNLLRLDEVFREMKGDGFEPDVVIYGIIINAYCKANKHDEAVQRFNEMNEKGIRPTPHIYCSLINGLGSAMRLTEALKYFELSKACGFVLEAPTYNALVGAYCWSMLLSDAFRVVEEMRECGVGPNSRTYDIIIHHLVKLHRSKEAYSVFEKMSNEPGCEPTVSTYEIIVRMFCNEDRMDMALKVWDQMKAKGILPGMHMFSTLINSLCQDNKLDDACRYFQQMLDVGIRPPANMFSKLKQALLDEGKEDIVIVLTHKLEKLRKIPLVF